MGLPPSVGRGRVPCDSKRLSQGGSSDSGVPGSPTLSLRSDLTVPVAHVGRNGVDTVDGWAH